MVRFYGKYGGFDEENTERHEIFSIFDSEFLVYSCRILVSELGFIPINCFIKMNIPVMV